MEDLGTLKEQHREQKLFPQLLQLRCRREATVSDGAHPQAPDSPVPLPLSPNALRLKWGLSGAETKHDKTANRGLIRADRA